MYKSTAANVLTILAAVFLSISLAFVGFATVGVYVGSSIFTPDTIVKMVQAGDYSDIMPADTFLEGMDSYYEVDDDFVGAMVNSKAFEEIVGELSGGMIDALAGEGDDEQILSQRDIRKIIKGNIDEIVEIIDDNVESDYSKSEIEDMILDNLDEVSEEISYNLPTTEDLADEIDPAFQDVFAFISGGRLLLIFVIVTLVIAIGLYFLRFKYLRGLIWVGSSGIAVSLFSLISGLSMGAIILILTGEAVYDSDLLIVNSFIDILASKFMTASAVVGVLSIVMLVVGIVVGNILKNKSVKA